MKELCSRLKAIFLFRDVVEASAEPEGKERINYSVGAVVKIDLCSN